MPVKGNSGGSNFGYAGDFGSGFDEIVWVHGLGLIVSSKVDKHGGRIDTVIAFVFTL